MKGEREERQDGSCFLSGQVAEHEVLEGRWKNGREQKGKWISQTPRSQGSLLGSGCTHWQWEYPRCEEGGGAEPGSSWGWAMSWGAGLELEEGVLEWLWANHTHQKFSPELPTPPKPQESQPLPLLQPSQPPGTRAESSDLTTAKITFPGKRFHLLKRILRKYCTQQWISDLFCSRWIFLSANKQVHQLMVWQAEFLKNIWLEHNKYSKMYYQNKCIYRQIKLELLSLKLGWGG